MDARQVAAYLARIGVDRTAGMPADVDTLRRLQLAHLRAVPFENLSIHLGEEIRLTDEALFDKIVLRRRGGFCYELNGAFGALLSALGYRVTLLTARVARADGSFGPPFDHLALRVDLASPWLVDVGFGRFSHLPLRLDVAEQADPGGVFAMARTGDGDIEVSRDGHPEYRLEPRSRTIGDFVPTCWYHRTSPDSHFTRSLVCSRLTAAGRVSLSGRTLVETTGAGRTERVLGPDDDVLGTYQRVFGIALDRIPPDPRVDGGSPAS